MTVVSLDQLVPGESGKITRIRGKGAFRRRLVDMGLTAGALIEMVKPSPLGDPVEYRVRGYHLSLRKSEAMLIEVELLGSSIPLRKMNSLPGTTLPLLMCRSGQKVVISHTRGGRRLHKRLQDLGLIAGADLVVLSNDFPGPCVVSVSGEKRLVLGKGMAMHILVKPA